MQKAQNWLLEGVRTLYSVLVVTLFTFHSCTSKDGTPTSKTFEHVTSEIGAEEAEEVGVEHLLR